MNVQNLPRDFVQVKQAFIPKRGAFLFADYRNIEPRIFAYFAHQVGYKHMAEQFRAGLDDPYIMVAELIWPGESITKEQRQIAKRIFLTLLYGGGAGKIQSTLSLDLKRAVSYQEAKRLKDDVMRALPAITLLQDIAETQLEATRNGDEPGYLRTPWGRHLHLDRDDYFKALNAIIQGTAAGLMKDAAINVHGWLKERCFDAAIVNLVHDEIMLDTKKLHIPELSRELPKLMSYEPIARVVPIEVDLEYSLTNWADKKPYEGAL